MEITTQQKLIKMYLRVVLKLFLGNRSGVLLLLPPLVVMYVFLNYFFGHHLPELPSKFGFWGALLPESSWWSIILAPILSLLNAFLLNSIYNRNGFQEKNVYLPALLVIVIQSYFHSFYFLSGASLAITFLILSLIQLIQLDQNSDGRRAVFNASLLFGIAITFYPLLLTGIPFLFLIIWVLRPFVFRESALAMTGTLIPLVYAGVYRMVLGLRMDNNEFSSAAMEWQIPDVYVVGGAMLLITLFGLRPLSLKIQQSSIRLKKLIRINGMLLLYFALLAVMEIFFFTKVETTSFLLIPLLLIITYGFGTKNVKFVPSTVFYLMFIYSVGKFFVSFSL